MSSLDGLQKGAHSLLEHPWSVLYGDERFLNRTVVWWEVKAIFSQSAFYTITFSNRCNLRQDFGQSFRLLNSQYFRPFRDYRYRSRTVTTFYVLQESKMRCKPFFFKTNTIAAVHLAWPGSNIFRWACPQHLGLQNILPPILLGTALC